MLIDATLTWRLQPHKTAKEKVMNDEILIELGTVSEETLGKPGGEDESLQQPDTQPF